MENPALRRIRSQAKLTIDELAARSGVHGQTVWRLEKQGLQPRLPTARALARALSRALREPVAVDDIFPPGRRYAVTRRD